ncbi:MAG: cell division protein SepF [Eubacteriales bacterium]|nr:cell division protein SepF [Eubacteriales bacterium]
MGEGLFSKLKVLVGIEEIEEDDYEEERETPTLERKPIEPRNTYTPPKTELKDSRDNKDSRILPMAASKATSPNQMKMVVIEPKSIDECPRLVDSLKAKKPIIINLEKIETDSARKIFDFLSGATYALNGNIQKVANNIFLFAPENVDISAQVDQKNGNFSEGTKNPWR